jgi:YD repeat-containing protein
MRLKRVGQSFNLPGANICTYDADDRISSAADNRLQAQGKPGVTTYSYDPAGNLTNYVYPNTVSTAYTFNTLNRVTGMNTRKQDIRSLDDLNNTEIMQWRSVLNWL